MFLVPVTRYPSHLARSIDRLFDGSFDRVYASDPVTQHTRTFRSPALDVQESEAAYTVVLDMPGVAKQDVKVSIDGKRVGVQAQGPAAPEATAGAAADTTGERIVYRERAAVGYSRVFTLPEEVDQAESSAKLENGVLTLTLNKKRAAAAKQITVN